MKHAQAMGTRGTIAFIYRVWIVLFASCFLAWVLIRPGGDDAALWFSDITLTAASTTAGLAAFCAALTLKGKDRLSWILIAAGILAWGFGIATWSYYELILNRDTPFPSLADVGYLAMIPLVFVGLVTLPAPAKVAEEARIKVGLDALLIMASIATFSWYAIIGPTYTTASASLIEKAIGLAYPAGDVVLLFAIIGGVARGWASRRSPVYVALAGGIVAFVAADSSFAFLTLHDAYKSGNPIDLGWPLGLLLISYATVHRWAAGESERAPESRAPEARAVTLARQIAPFALVLGVAGLLFVSRLSTRGLSSNIFVACALITMMLVVVRQFVTVRENERLAGELRSLSAGLETTVAERTARLSTLHQVASSLNAASSVNEVSEVALAALMKEAGCRGAAFYQRPEDDTDKFHLVKSVGTSIELSPDQARSLLAQPPAVLAEVAVEISALHIPVASRDVILGELILWGFAQDAVVDKQTLGTIANEFGVAHENQQRYTEAKALADRDPVTSLFNHRYFHKQVTVLIEEHKTLGKPFGLTLMDIDDFKIFNDTYGHPKGDAVLKLIAAKLVEMSSGWRATAARFGGDEFAVLLPGCRRQETIEFMREFREWVGLQSFQENGGERIPIRISMGCSTFPEDGERAFEIVSAADSSLYDSKRAGAFDARGIKPVSEIVGKGGSFQLLEGLITAVDHKDQYTKAHCDSVAEFAVMIAEALGLSPEVQRSLAVAGALHDVGKICIPDRVLRKPGPLTDEEYETVKMHVPLAENLIQNVPRRKDVLDAVLYHHERFDGSGYPKGARGREIPFVGRIISVADAFSAMTLDRPYRKAMPIELAIKELLSHAGKQFDPEVVEAFVKELKRRAMAVAS